MGLRIMFRQQPQTHDLMIETPEVALRAAMAIPKNARSIVLFAHGAGSSRNSPRNRYIAQKLQGAGFATLLMDLLTEEEERIDTFTGRLRFDIPLLAGRLESVTGWVLSQERMREFDIGYFGADTGAAAAFIAAIQRPQAVRAIISRGGRPDLAFHVLPEVRPPVMLLVGAKDQIVLDINREASKRLTTEHSLVVIPGASHLFEEPGRLDTAARRARRWFTTYMRTPEELEYAGAGGGIDGSEASG